MFEDFYDRPILYGRADPDDEFDHPKPEPLDPYLIDEEGRDIDDEEEELDEDEI